MNNYRGAVLRGTRALIADPKDWLQGATSRDINGKLVNWDDPTACRCCLLAAAYTSVMNYCEDNKITDLADKADIEVDTLWMLITAMKFTPSEYEDFHRECKQAVMWFNEQHTHDEVLALVDRAIEIAA